MDRKTKTLGGLPVQAANTVFGFKILCVLIPAVLIPAVFILGCLQVRVEHHPRKARRHGCLEG